MTNLIKVNAYLIQKSLKKIHLNYYRDRTFLYANFYDWLGLVFWYEIHVLFTPELRQEIIHLAQRKIDILKPSIILRQH